MRRPTPELLLRIAQADAYAMACEYTHRDRSDPEFQELLDLKRYMTHPTYHKLPAGTYTDDTQMSIAVAECLIENCVPDQDPGGSYLSGPDFAYHFFKAFDRDRRDGYSRGFQIILEASTTYRDMLSRIVPSSARNGACMRAVPIGVLSDVKDVLHVAEVQARVTHDTWGGIRSAQAVALMAHYALREPGELSDLPGYVVHHLPDMHFLMTPWQGPVDGEDTGIKTAHAACTLAATKSSLHDIMRQVIDWGGDTDSVAAVAWGVACPRMRDEKLPDFLETNLEIGTSGKYGAAFLRDLGSRLMEEFGG